MAPELRLSSITPVSYQATYVPVTPVRPVVYGGARPADQDKADQAPAQIPAAAAPGTGKLLDIKV